MATTRLPMRHLREIFRQKYELKRSHRAVARSLGLSAGSVAGAMGRAGQRGLDWASLRSDAPRGAHLITSRETGDHDREIGDHDAQNG